MTEVSPPLCTYPGAGANHYAQPEHTPCCSSHERSLCCLHYSKAHFVEVDPCSPGLHQQVVFKTAWKSGAIVDATRHDIDDHAAEKAYQKWLNRWRRGAYWQGVADRSGTT